MDYKPWRMEFLSKGNGWKYVSTFKHFDSAADCAPCKRLHLKKAYGNVVMLRLVNRATGEKVMEPQFDAYLKLNMKKKAKVVEPEPVQALKNGQEAIDESKDLIKEIEAIKNRIKVMIKNL